MLGAALQGCPWWLLVGFGFGLGAMTKQSLRRLRALLQLPQGPRAR